MAATTAAQANDKKDRSFLARVHAALQTAQAWDGDPLLLAECRARIPPNLLSPDSPHAHKDDDKLYHRHNNPNLLFLKRLAVFFQKSMTWVNNPPCAVCGSKETKLQTVRGPLTQDEREGMASRVEVYECLACHDKSGSTTFPRYNSVRKLLDTRRGRCGEYANLFGLYCRAAGYETRYISDFTDHVWVEVHVGGGAEDPWIMADGCEGIMDRPAMYESGWGKNLNYTIGATADSVTDVTPRYTRRWNSTDFQNRRREICSSEQVGQQLLDRVNASLREHLSKARREELDRQSRYEGRLFARYQNTSAWTPDEKHGQGRISGSLEWKLSRQEAGKLSNDATESKEEEEKKKHMMRAWRVESFCPRGETVVTIAIERDQGITVSGAMCSIVGSTISVAVMDEVYLGCLLQARGFDSWSAVAEFVNTLPPGRIVALHGTWTVPENGHDVNLSRLGGFRPPEEASSEEEEELMYIGQVELHPDWATTTCTTTGGCASLVVQLPVSKPETPLKLRSETNVCPRRVSARLPEQIMPLATQVLATNEQKRHAFAKFIAQATSKRYSGYTTQPDAPVYLLDAACFPFQTSKAKWNTYHFLPEPLVASDSDAGLDDTGAVTGTNATQDAPTFEIPVNTAFFTQLLGPNLLQKGSPPSALLDTTTALRDARLVALYFSAHWCGPCRRFSPMLSELYCVLKERIPHHGLEVVFVSSDRDEASFQHYFDTMPWLAIPFSSGQATIIPQVKAQFGIRGIPSLVVLDVVSGQVVVSIDETRAAVTQAAQRGEEAIEEMFHSWVGRIPSESKELYDMMALSLSSEDDENAAQRDVISYLSLASQAPSVSTSAMDPTSRIKELFAKLTAEGEEPNAAAAKAIQIVAEEQKSAHYTKTYESGRLSGLSLSSNHESSEAQSLTTVDGAVAHILDWNRDGKSAVVSVLSTALKYVGNVMKDPSNPRFRSFKLSNKVADRITRVQGGLDLICAVGFYVYPADNDFMACIPVGVNLDRMHTTLTCLVAENTDD